MWIYIFPIVYTKLFLIIKKSVSYMIKRFRIALDTNLWILQDGFWGWIVYLCVSNKFLVLKRWREKRGIEGTRWQTPCSSKLTWAPGFRDSDQAGKYWPLKFHQLKFLKRPAPNLNILEDRKNVIHALWGSSLGMYSYCQQFWMTAGWGGQNSS